jgi:aspartyl-tRNA(Asn)/glutamyl-tRNA(Gln) amidotransferase subunit A
MVPRVRDIRRLAVSSLDSLDLVGAVDAIRQGDVTAEQVTRWSLDRLERSGRAFNAVMRIEAESAVEAARAADLARAHGHALGALHGVPLAHKDLFYRAGRPCTGGSIIRRDYVPKETATVLARLDASGALDLGTLHMAEFAMSPTGYNEHYGHGRNPWDPAYASGGSSSGSAIAVAGRMVFGSLGTDTGGSIRHPSAMCGVTGLKPTLRRVSTAGVMPLSWSLDCVGPIAQSARDCARLLRVIAGADARDGNAADVSVPDYEARLDGSVRGLRIAVPRRYYDEPVTPDVRAALDESLRVLREQGAVVVETGVPDMDLINAMTQVVMACEAATIHRRWLVERPLDYADQVRARIEPGLYYPATRYIDALRLRTRLTEDYLAATLGDCDVIFFSTVPIPVPTIDATTTGMPSDVAASIAAITHCTRGINYLGLPALSIPAGFSSGGLPIAFQLVGKPFDEVTLLRAGDAFQRVTDWHRRIPGTVRKDAGPAAPA